MRSTEKAPIIEGTPLKDPEGKISGTVGLVPRKRDHATRIIVVEHADELIADPDRSQDIQAESED